MISPMQCYGKFSELLAKNYLLQQNLEFIANNYHCPFGEIDLIMLDVHTLVFVEVRSRRNYSFGHPVETIDLKKQNKLIKTAAHFTQHHFYFNDQQLRFDAITMRTPSLNSKLKELPVSRLCENCDLTWYKNIIEL